MVTRLTRRTLLGMSAGAMAGNAISGLVAADGSGAATMDLPIIDTHQHLWDLTKLDLSWLKQDSSNPLGRSFVMQDYQAATQGLQVVKTVYMEVDVAPHQKRDEVAYVTDLCERDDNPMAAAVVGAIPGDPSFRRYVQELAKNKYIRGVRQVLHAGDTPPETCIDPQFVASIRELGDLNLSFDLCMRPADLPFAVQLVEKCPNTRFILDHCGNMPVASTDDTLRKRWEAGMRELAARPNVVCKVSGIIAAAPVGWKATDLASVVNTTLDTFGEDRVMFAADWPVCTLRATFWQWVMALAEIVALRTLAARRKLFHDNAAAYYRLG